MKPNQKVARLAILLSLFTCSSLQAAGPTVSNVRSAQRPGTQLVDVDYDLADPDSPILTVSVAVSTNGGASYTLPVTSFTGALGVSVTAGREQTHNVERRTGLAEQVFRQCPFPRHRQR